MPRFHPRRLSASITLIATAILTAATPASASLFFNPAGGTILSFDDADDGSSTRNFWKDTSYFGQPIPGPSYGQVTVSINGHLRFGDGSNHDYDPSNLGSTAVNRIAPLWMDFNLGSGGQIIENIGSGDSYYAVTWLNMEKSGVSGYFASFQVILFETATVLNGESFTAGDILFSYGDIGIYSAPADPEVTQTMVGLESATGSFATLPGHESIKGWHSFENTGAFPVGEYEYVLFHANGGNYDVSIETFAVPEPSSYASRLGGLVLAGVLLRRRR